VIPTFFAALLMVTVVASVCTLIAMGVETALGFIWRWKFRSDAPIDFLLILSYVAALLIAIWGEWVVPQFQVLYGSFGPDMPWPLTRIVIQYRHLLVLPLIAPVWLHFHIRRPAARSYVFFVLTGEFALSVIVVTSMYLPTFSFSEAVQG
jgi:hypothetical protein